MNISNWRAQLPDALVQSAAHFEAKKQRCDKSRIQLGGCAVSLRIFSSVKQKNLERNKML